MTRSALPQNYIRNAGTLLEGFGNVLDWTVENNGTLTADTTNYKVGTQAIKFSVTTASMSVRGTKTISVNFSYVENIEVWYYLNTTLTTIGDLVLYFSTTTNFATKWIAKNVKSLTLYAGWNRVVLRLSDFTITGGESLYGQMIRMRIKLSGEVGQLPSVTLGAVYYNRQTAARCVFTFDDNGTDKYNYAYAYMQPRGIPGTVFVNPSGIGDVGSLSLANLQAMYDSGWAICNHSNHHYDLTSLSEEDAQEDIQSGRDWLVVNGMPRAANYFAYPFGLYNAMVRSALANVGCYLARATNLGYLDPLLYSAYALPIVELTYTVTLATAKAAIDSAISTGKTVIFLGHNFPQTATVAQQWSRQNLYDLVDYAIARRIKCVTIDEWYNGLTNPRYQSLPMGRTVG